MDLDPRVCSQARLSRDPRFDGRFFIAVLTTGIYCRPICPARSVKEENVRYFPTAAAAAEAGFRPCLRCRPESSPGTPAWLGTCVTVSRALRLISETALEDGGVDALASRLGIGARHLRRLFLQHVGASPIAVANTRRLHFAKKLIDETDLPMARIALAAGFGSVRRFNSAFRSTYNRTPTDIRRLARRAAATTANEYQLKLQARPPFDWNRLTAFLSLRAIPGVESVDRHRYCRTISVNGQPGHVSVALAPDGFTLDVRISIPDPRGLFLVVERVRRIFDLAADPIDIAGCLQADPLLSKYVAAVPGLRVPGCWDGFELAVRAVLGQQISVKGASTLAGRIAKRFGRRMIAPAGLTHLFPEADALADADIAQIGLPAARAETIRALARAVVDRRVTFESVGDVDECLARLRGMPGIGDWTVQYIAMRAFGEPDAFPAADLGLLRGAGLEKPRDLLQHAESWRPWRAYAAMYLWQAAADVDILRGVRAR